MTEKNPGKIVTYVDKDGNIQKAISYNKEQVRAFTDWGRVFLRLVNDDMSFKEENGKKLVCCRKAKDLTIIGFTD